MNWLSGAVPGIFSPDRHYIPLVYRMLRTRLFDMTHDDAMEMTERCFCEEHEGHHVAAKYHQRALDDNRGYIADLDYIWKSNCELRLMQEASIARTVQDNQRAFKRFAWSSRRYGNGHVED